MQQNNIIRKLFFFKPIDIFVPNKKKFNYVDAGVIIKEKNLSSIIESNIIEDISYFYKESNYSNLIESVVDKYYQNQQLYDVFIIEGITVKFTTDIEYRFNLDIAKSLNAEIIFSGIFNNKLDKFCINHIRNILSKCILDFSSSNKISLILNKVNSSQIIQNKNYFGINFEILGICHNLTLLSKKLVEDVSNFNLISVVGCIPWNKRFCRVPIIKIVDYFKKEIVYLGKVFNHSVQCYDVFDQKSTNIINKINEDSLIFVPCERLDLLKIIYIAISKGIKIKAIILTGQVTSLIHSSFVKICCKIALFKVTIFSTNRSTLSTVFSIKKDLFNCIR
ncbi:AAA family ATPase [Buchnera aphidicola (Hormaphis cornu)]|nr:AAA family ATPase [Buchnera aphidicola (Hormaphis cornu)]